MTTGLYLEFNNVTNDPTLKWATDLHGHVSREDARTSTWKDGPVASPHREASESAVTCHPTLGWDVCNGKDGKDGVGRERVQDGSRRALLGGLPGGAEQPGPRQAQQGALGPATALLGVHGPETQTCPQTLYVGVTAAQGWNQQTPFSG